MGHADCAADEICFGFSSACNIDATCQQKRPGCAENTCACVTEASCAPPGQCFEATTCAYCL